MEQRDIRVYTYEGGGVLHKLDHRFCRHKHKTAGAAIKGVEDYMAFIGYKYPNRANGILAGKQFLLIEYTGTYQSKIIQVIS